MPSATAASAALPFRCGGSVSPYAGAGYARYERAWKPLRYLARAAATVCGATAPGASAPPSYAKRRAPAAAGGDGMAPNAAVSSEAVVKVP